MPELPEVEATKRALAPLVEGKTIERVVIRERRLRWPIPEFLGQVLTGKRVVAVRRRAKYLLVEIGTGTLIVHLGMSGSICRAVPRSEPRKHDHVEITMDDDTCLRYHDPRRFGSMHWTDEAPESHELLKDLGPEPLGPDFDAGYLYACSRNRKVAIKNFLMNAHVVVGVGNIYASESLYLSGIHPCRPAGRISKRRYAQLVEVVRATLLRSIEAGGTTLRDFVREDGEPGYFAQQLHVYGRSGENCTACGNTIRLRTIGQRSSFFCPTCQR